MTSGMAAPRISRHNLDRCCDAPRFRDGRVPAQPARVSLAFPGRDLVPLMLTTMRGQSSVVAGLALTSASSSRAAGSWTQARTSESWERRAMVRSGFALIAVGIAGVALVLWPAVRLYIC
jgi:hypothetical protein